MFRKEDVEKSLSIARRDFLERLGSDHEPEPCGNPSCLDNLLRAFSKGVVINISAVPGFVSREKLVEVLGESREGVTATLQEKEETWKLSLALTEVANLSLLHLSDLCEES